MNIPVLNSVLTTASQDNGKDQKDKEYCEGHKKDVEA